MLQQDSPDDYVLATGKTYSVQQFLEETFRIAGLDIKECVEIDERLFRPHEVPLLLGDSSKARKKLKWTPGTSFCELVKMMYEYDLEQIK